MSVPLLLAVLHALSRSCLLAFLQALYMPFRGHVYLPFCKPFACLFEVMSACFLNRGPASPSGLPALIAQLTPVITVQLLFRCQGCLGSLLVSPLILGASFFSCPRYLLWSGNPSYPNDTCHPIWHSFLGLITLTIRWRVCQPLGLINPNYLAMSASTHNSLHQCCM